MRHCVSPIRLASQVLLATMAIPIVPVTSESTRFLQHDSFVHEKDRRLASLLRLSVSPTRHSLHKDLVSVQVMGVNIDTATG